LKTEKEIRKKVKQLTRKPTLAEEMGFSEAMRTLEADVLKWVLGEKDKLPFE
jgi:hypothetical protein